MNINRVNIIDYNTGNGHELGSTSGGHCKYNHYIGNKTSEFSIRNNCYCRCYKTFLGKKFLTLPKTLF